MERRCKWHECGKEFTPGHAMRQYCSPKCRKRRLDWTKSRGSAIVNRILSTSPSGLHVVAFDEQRKLLAEIHGKAPHATKKEINDLKKTIKRIEFNTYNG